MLGTHRHDFEKWRALPPGSEEREEAMKKAYYLLAVQNPGVVAWYCGLKLEMAVGLLKQLISRMLQSDVVPGRADARRLLTEELRRKMGCSLEIMDIDFPDLEQYGKVTDYYASLEWSAGGLVHVHIALWIVGSPRIDKVETPFEAETAESDQSLTVRVDITPSDAVPLPQAEAANLLGAFWDRVYTEFNVAKHLAPEDLRAVPGVRASLGKKKERAVKSPESLSSKTLSHCLLGTLDLPTPEEENACWQELDDILQASGRPFSNSVSEGSDDTARRAQARKLFVAALAEWVNMHDLHAPWPMGPPGKEQACATVENEHSSQERCFCNKLYPRKIVAPGQEEILEDPRRRDLYRLWLGRNCHFLNNFIPVVLLMMLSNMDFQATLSKDAVIEYLTKYMTKSGQGSLVKVMENSFSLCIEKAREQQQGAGSAMVKWFNLQSLTEVKAQLETMHLVFDVPRFFCSREFVDLWLKSEVRSAKTKDQILASEIGDTLTGKSPQEVYLARCQLEIPSRSALLDIRPGTSKPLWRDVLEVTGQSLAAVEASLHDHYNDVLEAWPRYLELLSWWQLKRYLYRSGQSLKCKPQPAIVVIHPVGRFNSADTAAQWRDAAVWNLIAHCNHGPECTHTFPSAEALLDVNTFSDEQVQDLMAFFAHATREERASHRMSPCPPHVKNNWMLGMARKERKEQQKLTRATKETSLPKVRFVFEEESQQWQSKLYEDMLPEEQEEARESWKEAEAVFFEHLVQAELDDPVPISPAPVSDSATSSVSPAPVSDSASACQRRMHNAIKDCKWTVRELHDAALLSGLAAPTTPDLLSYFTLLSQQWGDAKAGFLPQHAKSHSKERLQKVLMCLSRTGLKMGGTTGTKDVLAQRLSHWIAQVLEAGQQVPLPDDPDGVGVDEKPRSKVFLQPHVGGAVGVPDEALVTPEQAESALGHVQATEYDAEWFEELDMDQKEEEMALLGKIVNPPGVNYDVLAWSPISDSDVAASVGWHPPLALRAIEPSEWRCTLQEVQAMLNGALQTQEENYAAQLQSPGFAADIAAAVLTLDPTQKLLYDTVVKWGDRRLDWEKASGWGCERPASGRRAPPALLPGMAQLLLGTAGTGKTHTAKTAIGRIRSCFGSFQSVLTVAFSGVAAANLGSGARTIDSIFHTNTDHAAEDLVGDSLDALVDLLQHVRLIVIEEISTIGAVQFAVLCRRLQQVSRVLWRRNFGTPPPDDFGLTSQSLTACGLFGILVMGDFAQLPPVLSSTLLPDVPVVVGAQKNTRFLAMQGRQIFSEITQIIRLRRVHRQKGADLFKESTLRLRDAAITLEDYQLWMEHSVDLCGADDKDAPWEGGEQLLDQALYLVADNSQAGRINGQRLAARAQSLTDAASSGPLTPLDVVVRCEASHNNERGVNRKADAFQNMRKALHLCVGAKVILILNRIWGVNTVPLGLMNGARGTIVAILYCAPNGNRADGNVLAGVGYPTRSDAQTLTGALPRGKIACPLPDYVVVHFPEYTGPALFQTLPRTWVPIPAEEVRSDSSKQLLRVGLPLKLAWALTVHKSQGITSFDGTVISFEGARMPRPVATVGWAFVAWTRATSWKRVAFRSLPPVDDFLAVRQRKEFQARSLFEAKADSLHDLFLREAGISAEDHLQAHRQHFAEGLWAREQRTPDSHEIEDLGAMLSHRGVLPVSDSMNSWLHDKVGKKSGLGITALLAACKRDRKLQDAGDRKGQKGKKKSGEEDASWETHTKRTTLAILHDMDFAEELIAEAMGRCKTNCLACMDYCVDKAKDPASDTAVAEVEEFEAAEAFHQLGFSVTAVTRALELAEFSFSKALQLLLYGNDLTKWKSVDADKRFRRHLRSKIHRPKGLSSQSVWDQYKTRALQDLSLQVEIFDFNECAGDTTGACFWLCLAAGLTDLKDDIGRLSEKALPAKAAFLQQATGQSLTALHNAAPVAIRASPLGRFAAALRAKFCEGPNAVLLQPAVKAALFPAFASLSSQSQPRTLIHYKAWVEKLGKTEYADELILAAVARELKLRIVVVPWTPKDAAAPWVISSYPDVDEGDPQLPTIYVGNNDVHYVWLGGAKPVSDS